MANAKDLRYWIKPDQNEIEGNPFSEANMTSRGILMEVTYAELNTMMTALELLAPPGFTPAYGDKRGIEWHLSSEQDYPGQNRADELERDFPEATREALWQRLFDIDGDHGGIDIEKVEFGADGAIEFEVPGTAAAEEPQAN
jgi:hypothetical protein